ncbi:TIGR02530 family flagellar biosynthesis protein [Thalassobacillus sp. CUG 92003]|uniref:TIGR02530 family flagellar biosynthesis protein n=1 Tax=Thalassobacillus sp. CUG 92003 TaxID=2736641 RepID=UPI0015E747E8|nr:TIGR02530 family flagellar biosynthesis protein [Thalassobacillus sp. CUG 92003]
MEPRIHQLHQPLPSPKTQPVKGKAPQTAFKDILDQAKELKVSKHARQRLEERNITITQEQWDDISTKLTEAREKGVTESLVVLKDAALVASAKNQTVVTALSKEESQSHIFTNINGTILMNHDTK